VGTVSLTEAVSGPAKTWLLLDTLGDYRVALMPVFFRVFVRGCCPHIASVRDNWGLF